MEISVNDVNTFQPYIFNGYELFERRIHPAGYDITINKYCIEKIQELDISYPVELKIPIID